MIEYIEYYREDIDTSFEIPVFDLSRYDSIADFCEQEVEIFCESLVSGLYNAIELNVDWIPIFAIRNSDTVLSMESEYYIEKLKFCLDYYVSVENYEYCSILKILEEKHNNNTTNR
jgi:hypothetical protein